MKHLPFSATPIHALPYYSDLLGVQLEVKRDDLFLKAGGGNKARMLQYILAEVSPQNCDVLVTAGGPCSNFNRACALMCAELGVQMHLVEYTDRVEEFDTSLNYYICKLSGIKATRCDKSDVPDVINSVLDCYQSKGKKVKFVYGGGKSLQGVYAYYDAVKELYEQGSSVEHVFVACGTGTTLAGICAGMQKYYPQAVVHAVSTARTWGIEKSVLDEDLSVLNQYLGSHYTYENLQFSEDYLCGGYGKYHAEIMGTIEECISHEGMLIDPTYSGKAFYGMKQILLSTDEYKGSHVLFWNTGGMFNLLSNKQ